MKTTKNIARLAVTAGLTAALSFGGVMAPVTMAFAEDTATAADSIKINPSKGNENNQYKAYQIFRPMLLMEIMVRSFRMLLGQVRRQSKLFLATLKQ